MTSNQWGPTQHTIRSKNPHAKALGKLGGKVKSESKAAAARENGKKGGRPKKPTTRLPDAVAKS